MRAAGLILALLLISGCEDPNTISPDQQAMVDRMEVEWRDLPDGSKFGKSGGFDPEDEYGARCWEWKDGMYRCLEGGVTNTGVFSRTSVSIEYHNGLPYTVGLNQLENGYGCSHNSGFVEEVVRDGSALISNRPTYGNSRWSENYVKKFMADNGINGQAYFNCLDILQAINRGSIETLSTTEVTEGMLD